MSGTACRRPTHVRARCQSLVCCCFATIPAVIESGTCPGEVPQSVLTASIANYILSLNYSPFPVRTVSGAIAIFSRSLIAGRASSGNGSSSTHQSASEASATAAERRQHGAAAQPAAQAGCDRGLSFAAPAPWIAEASLQLPAGGGVVITPGLVAVRSGGATTVALAARAQWMF